MIGCELKQYRIEEAIGAGGMGVVYRAHDTRLSRDVALKVLPAGALADENARKRFRKEAFALSRLSHPHVASLFDFDTTEDGTDFLVMELVPGPSLDTRLKRGPLPEKDVVRLGAQVLRALVAAHEQGVLHRDLKPQNLKLTADGLVKVLDFGLARVAPAFAESQTTDTASGSVAGTPPYMSPEQLLGREVDARTDVYAAGVVLYEMATGRRPFGETSGPRLVAKILNEPMPPPRDVNPELSPVLEQVILKATDKDKELRHQTAKELLVDLERLAAGSSGAATRSSRTGAGAAATGRRRSPGWIAALVLAAGFGAAAPWFLRPREPRVTATRTLVRSGASGLETDDATVYYSVQGRLMTVPLSGGEPREVALPWRDSTGVVLAGRRPEPPALLLRRGSEAWELALSGGGPTRLEGLPPLADAEWSPRGDRLAWVETRDDREILWVGDARGRGPRKLAEAPKEGRGGRSLWLTGWDPSGERIRYVPRGAKRFLDASASSGDPGDAGVGEQADLWGTGAWTADGALFLHGSVRGVMGFPDRRWPRAPRRTVALGGPTHTWTIRATPDGRRLVGAIDRPGAEIVRVEPGRGTITPLLGRGWAGVLDFSPDGTRVAWAGSEGGLWVGRPDGTDRRPLGDRQPAPEFPIQWSPDGRWIAFSASEGVDVVDLEPRLFLASPTEGTVEPLTADDPGRLQGDPCWSPDGRWIAYGPSPVNGLPPEEEIYLRRVDLATRRVAKIEGSEGLWAPKCARDGRILATDELRARRAHHSGPGSPAPSLFYKLWDPATGQWTPLEVDMGAHGAGYLFYPT